MKQLLNDIRTQPESVQNLVSSMMLSAMLKRDTLHRDELDDQQKAWLRENGFPFSFNKEVFEWEILIKEES